MVEKELGFLVSSILAHGALDGVVFTQADGKTPLSQGDYALTKNADGTITVTASDLAKTKNWVYWETFRTFYAGVQGALLDTKYWPDVVPPQGQATVGGTLGQLSSVVAPIAAALTGPGGAALITAIEGLIGTAKTPVTVPTGVPSIPVASGS